MVAVTSGCGASRPGSLVPDEDQGYYIAAVILPDGASLERTDKVVNEVVDGDQVEPGQRERDRVHRLRLPRRRVSATARRRSSSPRSTGTSARCRPRRWSASSSAKTGHIKEALVLAFNAAADLRSRQRRRLRVLHPEPRRGRRAAARRGRAAVHRRRAQGSGVRAGARRSGAPTCRSSTSTSTARRRRRSACRSTIFTARWPRRSAPTTSTTSTSTAAPGRC